MHIICLYIEPSVHTNNIYIYSIHERVRAPGLRTTKFSGRPSFCMHESKFRNVAGLHKRPAMGSEGVWILIVLGRVIWSTV